MFSLESPHRGDSNVYTQYTIFTMKKEKYPKLSQICSYGIFFQGTQERVRNRRGKPAISVRATEGLLYKQLHQLLSLGLTADTSGTFFLNFSMSAKYVGRGNTASKP